MAESSLRKKYLTRKNALWQERSTWLEQWREVSRYLLPRNGRFLVSDRNKGEKRHNAILDSTGTRALRVLAAGLMAGMTSPARPWFRLETSDKELMEYEPVKVWLNDLTELMRQIFARSNTYRSLHMIYEELAGFGTGATIVLGDFESVIHHFPLTIGEYAIATDYRGVVNTLYREFDMTVAQVVGQFGINNVSGSVKSLFDTGNLDKWVTVTHVIEPREDRDARIKNARNMPVASCYFESNSSDAGDKMLRESGFKRFPALAPRWAATGGDIYGNCPGQESLGDMKQMQHEQLRKGQSIDFMVRPPMQMPPSMKGIEVNSLPGGASYIDQISGGAKPLFETGLRLDYLLGDIQDIRMRIKETFYENLFLMLASQDQGSPITAREVAEKHEEKLLMLGPVLERLHNELLKRFIDITFDEMLEAGIVPQAPPEMQGQELNVEFVSMLAQAQRAIGVGSIDRYTMMLGSIAQLKPAILDKLDEDELADKYGEMLGVDPTLIVASDKVAIVREQRAQAQQAAAQQQQMAQMAQTASVASTVEPDKLQDIASMFSGYGGPGMPAAA